MRIAPRFPLIEPDAILLLALVTVCKFTRLGAGAGRQLDAGSIVLGSPSTRNFYPPPPEYDPIKGVVTGSNQCRDYCKAYGRRTCSGERQAHPNQRYQQ